MTAHEMPTPGPKHDVIKRLAGRWIGEEKMMPSPWSPEAQERTGFIDARMLEGFFVVSDYEQKAGDEVTFRGHGVYSYDPQEDAYVMYWFDSMGGAGGVAKGGYENGVLTFRNTSPMGHHRYRYTFSEGETKFEMAMSSDGEAWNDLMVATYRPAEVAAQ